MIMTAHEIAGVNEFTGQPITHLVKASCSQCGAFVAAAPAYADVARCTGCMFGWAADPNREPIVPSLHPEVAPVAEVGRCCGSSGSLPRCALCPSSASYWRLTASAPAADPWGAGK